MYYTVTVCTGIFQSSAFPLQTTLGWSPDVLAVKRSTRACSGAEAERDLGSFDD